MKGSREFLRGLDWNGPWPTTGPQIVWAFCLKPIYKIFFIIYSSYEKKEMRFDEKK